MAAQGFSYFSMCRAPAFSCGGGMYPQTVYPKGPGGAGLSDCAGGADEDRRPL